MAVAGDTCQIANGTYRETVTPASSGSSGAHITFAAAPGATPKVTGTNAVTGWSLAYGNVYSAPASLSAGTGGSGYSSTAFPANTDLWANQVFANGTNLPEAQYPEPGTDPAAPAYKKITAISGSTITDPDLPDLGDLTGATAYFTGGWVATSGAITSNSAAGHSFTFSSPGSDSRVFPSTSTGLSNAKSFKIVGKKSLLTQPGEWFYDPSAARLLLWAPGGGVPTGVEAKARNYSFDLAGRHDIAVTGLTTTASTIRTDSSSYGITLDSLDASFLAQWQTAQYDSTLPFNGIYDANHKRDSGIILAGHDNTLRNSRINLSMGNALAVDGYNMAIQNNLITNIAYGGTYSSAVSIRGGSHDITIAQNTMRSAGRDMVNMNTNVSTELTYKNITISRNEMTDYARLALDLGAIYSCCDVDLTGSRFDHNWLHDPAQEGNGIHLDNGSYGVTSIDHNVIWGLRGGAGIAHGGSVNGNPPTNLKANITNNTMIVGGGYTIVTYYADQSANANQVVTNNILDGQQASRDLNGNGNLVTKASNSGPGPDPAYVNAAAGNYQLQPGSPAARSGIVVAGITSSAAGSVQAGAYEGGVFTPGCNLPGCTQPNTSPTVPVAGHTYTITARHSGKLLDAAYQPTSSNPSPPSPLPVVQNGASGTPSQRWRTVPTGASTSTFTLVNQENGLCATTSGTALGTPIGLSACGSSNSQQFSAPALTNGYNGINLVSVATGLCMDVNGANLNDNAPLTQYTCGNQPNQQLQLADAALDATVSLQAVFSGKNVDAGATTSSGQLTQRTATGDANQAWTLTRGADGYYAVRSTGAGGCLQVSTSSAAVTATSCANALQQKWALVPASSGSAYLITSAATGDCLDVNAADPGDGALVQHYSCGGGANQRWSLPVTTVSVDDAVQGSGPGQLTYAGAWGHATGDAGSGAPYAGTNSYTTTSGATAKTTFVGTGISLYGVKAPAHGIAAVSVDGGTETLIDLYASTRAGNQLVWSSPYLRAGAHTLTIRATGTKSTPSSGTYTSLDRVTIAP